MVVEEPENFDFVFKEDTKPTVREVPKLRNFVQMRTKEPEVELVIEAAPYVASAMKQARKTVEMMPQDSGFHCAQEVFVTSEYP